MDDLGRYQRLQGEHRIHWFLMHIGQCRVELIEHKVLSLEPFCY